MSNEEIVKVQVESNITELIQQISLLITNLRIGLIVVVTQVASGFSQLLATIREINKTDSSSLADSIVSTIDNTNTLIEALGNVGKVGDFFKILIPKDFDALKEKVLGLFGTDGTLTKAITGLGSAVAPAFEGIKTAALGAFKAIGNHPVIAIITAIITVIILLYTNCEWFRDLVDTMISFISDILGGLWEFISGFVDAIIEFFTVTVPVALSNLGETFGFIGDFIMDCWDAVLSFLGEVVTGIIEFFTVNIPEAIVTMLEFFGNIPYYIGFAIGAVLGIFAQFAVDLYTWVTVEIPMFIDNIIAFFAELPDKIWQFLCDVANFISTWGSDLITNGGIAIGSFIDSVMIFISELPGKIWTTLCDVVTKIGTWGGNLASKGLEAAQNLFTTISNKIKELPGEMVNVGKNLVKGIWDGIKDMGGWIFDQISSFCDGILDGFTSFFGINSPSRLFRDEIGKFLPQGIVVGFESEMPNVQNEIESSLANMNDSIQGAMEVEATKNMALHVQSDTSYSGLGAQLSLVLEDAMNTLLERILLEHNIIIGGKVVQRELTPLVNKQLALATSRGGRQ